MSENPFNACRRSNVQHPCKDCPDRKAACSVGCKKWAAYVEKRNAGYAERHKAAERRAGTNAYAKSAARRPYLKKKDHGMH